MCTHQSVDMCFSVGSWLLLDSGFRFGQDHLWQNKPDCFNRCYCWKLWCEHMLYEVDMCSVAWCQNASFLSSLRIHFITHREGERNLSGSQNKVESWNSSAASFGLLLDFCNLTITQNCQHQHSNFTLNLSTCKCEHGHLKDIWGLESRSPLLPLSVVTFCQSNCSNNNKVFNPVNFI